MPAFPTTPISSPAMTPVRPVRAQGHCDSDRSYNQMDMTTPIQNMSAQPSTPMAPRKSLRSGNATKRPTLSDRLATSSPIVWPSSISTPVMSRNIRTPSAPMKPGRLNRRMNDGPIPLQLVEQTPSRVVASFANLDMEENMRTPATYATPSHPSKRVRRETVGQMVSLSDRLDTTQENGWSGVPSEKIRNFRDFVTSDAWAALETPVAPSRSDRRRVSLSDRMKNSARLMRGNKTTDAENRLPTPSDRLTETPTRRWNVFYQARRRVALNRSIYMGSPDQSMDIDENDEE